MPASAVTASMPAIIPFNLLKGILNTVLFLMLYKQLRINVPFPIKMFGRRNQ